MDRPDIFKGTAGVSSQRLEEMDHSSADAREMDNIMGVFDKLNKESVDKVEEYLDKLEGR